MVSVIVLFVSLAGDSDLGIAAPLVFALALFLFAHEGGWVSALLRTPFMLRLGALSYSIYMVHIFVQSRLINVAGLVERKLGLGLIGDIVLRGQPAMGFGAGWMGSMAYRHARRHHWRLLDHLALGRNAGHGLVPPAFETHLTLGSGEHDPEKWEPVFGKDHAQTRHPLAGFVHLDVTGIAYPGLDPARERFRCEPSG